MDVHHRRLDEIDSGRGYLQTRQLPPSHRRVEHHLVDGRAEAQHGLGRGQFERREQVGNVRPRLQLGEIELHLDVPVVMGPHALDELEPDLAAEEPRHHRDELGPPVIFREPESRKVHRPARRYHLGFIILLWWWRPASTTPAPTTKAATAPTTASPAPTFHLRARKWPPRGSATCKFSFRGQSGTQRRARSSTVGAP